MYLCTGVRCDSTNASTMEEGHPRRGRMEEWRSLHGDGTSWRSLRSSQCRILFTQSATRSLLCTVCQKLRQSLWSSSSRSHSSTVEEAQLSEGPPQALASSRVNDRFLNDEDKADNTEELSRLARNACRREQRAKERLEELLESALEVSGDDHQDLNEAFGVVDRESLRSSATPFKFPDDDMQLLWESQLKYISTDDNRRFHWHPRWADCGRPRAAQLYFCTSFWSWWRERSIGVGRHKVQVVDTRYHRPQNILPRCNYCLAMVESLSAEVCVLFASAVLLARLGSRYAWIPWTSGPNGGHTHGLPI